MNLSHKVSTNLLDCNEETWNRRIKHGQVKTHREHDIGTDATCIYCRLFVKGGGHVPETNLHIRILFNLWNPKFQY